MQSLPIDRHVPAIRDAVDRARACVVVAPPGAGKTTRVPPALLDPGACIVLQPRRAAARAVARRIAAERGWSAGREVGWQVRFERRYGPGTRLLVATEGVLTARVQSDPLLSGFATVVIDEFHERSVHADLALAFVREAARARDDLRVVVMSATLDPGPVAAYLDGCPVVEVPGRPHPVEVEHLPGAEVAEGVRAAIERTSGGVLAFLPGVGEIERAREALADVSLSGIDVVPLHGSLPAAAQDAALAPDEGRRVILATNLAETSVTVEGVTAVVDTGLHKVLRFEADRGVDRLETERAPADSIEQRTGRAGRTGPGVAFRLFDPRDERPPAREPELARIDLAPVALDILAWGGDPRTFPWFEPPPPDRIEAALGLLRALGATDGETITDRGRALRRLPLHPRLARLVEAAGQTDRACAAAAWIAESRRLEGDGRTTASDLLSLADRVGRAPHPVRRAYDQLRRRVRDAALPATTDVGEERLLRAVLAAWPDRVARRRETGSSSVLLASGAGAVLSGTSGVRDGTFLVAVAVHAGRRGQNATARVDLASRVERDWIEPDRTEIEHRLDPAAGVVRATRVDRIGAVALSEAPAEPDREQAATLLAEHLLALEPGDDDARLLRRARFAGVDLDRAACVRAACADRSRLPAFRLVDHVPYPTRAAIDRGAPEAIEIPTGRRARLEYREDGGVFLSVKLQELFGLADTPRIGPDGTPVTVELLAPSGRPVQTTQDLRGFWERGYAEVRRELRGRYPKHPWPEDPWSAPPTARAKRRPPRSRD